MTNPTILCPVTGAMIPAPIDERAIGLKDGDKVTVIFPDGVSREATVSGVPTWPSISLAETILAPTERAAIVAWLRSHEPGDWLDDVHIWFADAIERGDHIPRGEER